MKHAILIASLLCALFSRSSAQTTATYFDSTSFWGHYQWFTSANFPGGCTHQINTYYTIDGDSIALGLTWYRLFSTGRYQLDCTYPTTHSDTKYAHRYTGLLRQDGRKMRMIFPGTMTDSIIYDFDLNVGDTFLPSPPFPQSPNNVVASIWPLSTDASRSVFESQSQFPEWGNLWVEGVGASRGPIFGPQLINCYSSQCATIGGLTCYKMQGNEYGYSGCAAEVQGYEVIVQAVTDTENVPDQVPGLRLSPNPGHDYLEVHVSGMEVREIRLCSASGQILRFQSNSLKETGGIISLPVDRLPAGIYQVMVFGANRMEAQKWLKF